MVTTVSENAISKKGIPKVFHFLRGSHKGGRQGVNCFCPSFFPLSSEAAVNVMSLKALSRDVNGGSAEGEVTQSSNAVLSPVRSERVVSRNCLATLQDTNKYVAPLCLSVSLSLCGYKQ